MHTRLKPFALIHPNSTIAQYHSGILDYCRVTVCLSQSPWTRAPIRTAPRRCTSCRCERLGCPPRRQRHLQVYGLLLETTKAYICNVMPVPLLYSLVFAKKVEEP